MRPTIDYKKIDELMNKVNADLSELDLSLVSSLLAKSQNSSSPAMFSDEHIKFHRLHQGMFSDIQVNLARYFSEHKQILSQLDIISRIFDDLADIVGQTQRICTELNLSVNNFETITSSLLSSMKNILSDVDENHRGEFSIDALSDTPPGGKWDNTYLLKNLQARITEVETTTEAVGALKARVDTPLKK